MKLNDFPLLQFPRPIPSRRVKTLAKRSLLLCLLVTLAVTHFSLHGEDLAADAASGKAASAAATNDVESQMLRSYLLLQDQLRATQRAVEQAREQAQADARRSEELLASRLNLIEQTLSTQRAQEMASLQQSTRTVTIISFAVTAVGFFAVLFAGLVQLKAMSRLAEVSKELRTALPTVALGDGRSPALLTAGRDTMEASNTNLIGAIDRLQKRLEDMEAATVGTQTVTHGQPQLAAPLSTPQVTTVLAKGQALLNLDKIEEALYQFDEAIKIEPKNTEAWIKRGTALERLQRVDEAITAYDQAIAADSSTATAYLFKAGVYNRQKKYAEALQCYEKALSAQQKVRAQATRPASQ
jgi:tetratricopeptide (TPR) repeat protein